MPYATTRDLPDGSTSTASPDPGLFGPDSVTWKVVVEPVSFVGGLRALLMQALHPAVVAGFDIHSDYRERPWRRLQRTADFVGVTSFADTPTVHRMVSRVRSVHALTWVDPETGAERTLGEPDLLLWVHTCLVDSLLDSTERAGLSLTGPEQDTFVAEQARIAELLGVPGDLVPRDRAALARYFAQSLPGLRLTPPAVEAVALLMAPPIPLGVELLTPARAGLTGLAALAYASLPRWARDRFPVPAGPAPLTEAAATAGLKALRTAGRGVRAVVPAARYSPHEKEARRRLGLIA